MSTDRSEMPGATTTCSNNVAEPVTFSEVLKAMEKLPSTQRNVIAERMRKLGFDPEHDWCFVPARFRETAGAWPVKYIRFSPYIDRICFVRNPALKENSFSDLIS